MRANNEENIVINVFNAMQIEAYLMQCKKQSKDQRKRLRLLLGKFGRYFS